jgi:hypothetical protein
MVMDSYKNYTLYTEALVVFMYVVFLLIRINTIVLLYPTPGSIVYPVAELQVGRASGPLGV